MITLPVWLFAVIIFAVFLFAMFIMSAVAGCKFEEYEATIKKLEDRLKDIKHNYEELHKEHTHLVRVTNMVNTVKENVPEQIKKTV